MEFVMVGYMTPIRSLLLLVLFYERSLDSLLLNRFLWYAFCRSLSLLNKWLALAFP